MVAVGRGLVAAPRCLLLDEPSLGLAPIVTQVVFSVLQEVSSRVGMLVVEQNTAKVLALCQRGYLLAEGKVVLSGSSGELSDRHELIAAYLQSNVLKDHLEADTES